MPGRRKKEARGRQARISGVSKKRVRPKGSPTQRGHSLMRDQVKGCLTPRLRPSFTLRTGRWKLHSAVCAYAGSALSICTVLGVHGLTTGRCNKSPLPSTVGRVSPSSPPPHSGVSRCSASAIPSSSSSARHVWHITPRKTTCCQPRAHSPPWLLVPTSDARLIVISSTSGAKQTFHHGRQARGPRRRRPGRPADARGSQSHNSLPPQGSIW